MCARDKWREEGKGGERESKGVREERGGGREGGERTRAHASISGFKIVLPSLLGSGHADQQTLPTLHFPALEQPVIQMR